MERAYKGRYYDGLQSTAIVVSVFITNTTLNIQYQDADEQTVLIEWPKEGIQKVSLASTHIALKYGKEYPYQQVELTDIDFIAAYQDWTGGQLMQRWLQMSSTTMVLALLAGIVAVMVGLYLWGVPWIADKVAQQVPVEYEVDLGKSIASQITTNKTIDSNRTEAINHFFEQLKLETTYPVAITVIKSPVVNAFALPGGQIVVYDSMLVTLQKPEELAALLCHEFAHVQLKHSTRNIFRTLSGYLFVSALFGDFSGISAVIIGNANELRNLSYSRELESEADGFALAHLKKQRIDIKGMIGLFEKLQQSQTVTVSEWMSTHPDLSNRIQKATYYQQNNPYTVITNDSMQFYFNQLQQSNEWQ
ncbi:MAG: M48 family metallopeptidase [Bacteroidia bacterium]|jgi:predicted Zn-dependent protease|nr:M48 family metallopeptidase [Bacteroidia bacterium]